MMKMLTARQDNAYFFAKAAHEAVGQLRKYTGRPYIEHPVEVALIVSKVPHTQEMYQAALLHDVLEDTRVTREEIVERFGEKTAELVSWLTDASRLEDGNRETRKAIDRDHIAKAPPEAKTIKLADLISNTRNILAYDRDFARVYLREKLELLEVLKEGNASLWSLAHNIARQGVMLLDKERDNTAEPSLPSSIKRCRM